MKRIAWFSLAAVMAAFAAFGSGWADEVHPAHSIRIPGVSLNEVSGIHRVEDVWLLVQDSGQDEAVHRIDSTGRPMGSIPILKSNNRDWEALCGTDSTILIADIGDNGALRNRIRVFGIPIGAALDTVAVTATTYRMTYPDGARNAEAFFADPVTGDWFIVTKAFRKNRLYRLPWPHQVWTIRTLEDTGIDLPGWWVHGADITRDGRHILVKSTEAVRLWHRKPDEAVMAALSRPSDRTWRIWAPMFEAVSIDADARGFVMLSDSPLRTRWDTRLRHYRVE